MKILQILIVANLIFPIPFEFRLQEIHESNRYELKIDDSEYELILAPNQSPAFYYPASPSCVWIGGIDYFFEIGFLTFTKMI